MNWQKANQALGNIERLLQVFESSNNLSAIERDLLLRRIQDLYEIVLEEDETNNIVKSVPVAAAPPVIEKPKKVEVEEVALPKPKPVVITPKVETQVEKQPESVIETPRTVQPPKIEKPKVEQPKIEKPVIEKPVIEKPKVHIKPQIETPKPRVVEQPVFQDPAVETKFSDEEAEIIEELFEFKMATDLSEKLSISPISDLTTSMSINERFITISELFKGNKEKYDAAVSALNNFQNFEQAKAYILTHLLGEYDWTSKKKTKSAKAFIKKVWRRYL